MPARSTAKKKKRYRQIKGVKYDDAALTLCEDAILHGGRVTLFDAKAIHADVQDGGRVTPIEWATLKFIAEGGNGGAQFRVDASASAWLKARCEEHDPETGVTPARAPRAYRVEDGERCDANALAIADAAVARHGRLRIEDARAVWKDVHDGGRVTEIEYNTIARIAETREMTVASKKFLLEKAEAHREEREEE